MSRYYDIQIFNAGDATNPTPDNPDAGALFARFQTHPNGEPDPGALQVEFDVPVWAMAVPQGAASVRIWGVSLAQIGQASDFNEKTILVFGGMQKGLPLANPAQAGLLVQGTIAQAWGNWVGLNQNVQFTIRASGVGVANEVNIVLNWLKGQTLGAAVSQTLTTAFPGFSVDDRTSPNLILGADEHGVYSTMTGFGAFVREVSKPIIGGDYPGVDIYCRGKAFVLADGTVPGGTSKVIDFKDLIGQPTWIDPGTIQAICVMRADLQPTDLVTLPPGFGSIAPANPFVSAKDRSVFQGTFLVVSMRHIGSSRQPDALSWITAMNLSPTISTGA